MAANQGVLVSKPCGNGSCPGQMRYMGYGKHVAGRSYYNHSCDVCTSTEVLPRQYPRAAFAA